jgi:hypothetical protein
MSNTKNKELFSKKIYQGIRSKGFAWLVALLMIPRMAWPQTLQDTAWAIRDSILDARMDRLEWQANRRMELMQERVDETRFQIDSIVPVLEQLHRDLTRLEQEKLAQSEMIRGLGVELEASRASSERYRERLQRTLWLSATVLLTLLFAVFIILLLYSLKTRHLLDRLNWRLEQVRKELWGQMKVIRKKIKAVRFTKKKKS